MFTLPKRVKIEIGRTTLFSDKKPETWNRETDALNYFKFGDDAFLVMSEWDLADYTTFRLFHLGTSKDKIKEYKIMGANEADFEAGFFTADGKLYFWEQRLCDEKKVYEFNSKTLDFGETRFKGLKGENCLPKNLASAQKKNKIKKIRVLERK